MSSSPAPGQRDDQHGPPAYVLDLFATTGDVVAPPGGSGRTAVVGDLVLSPGRDERLISWQSPILARLSVRLAEQPNRGSRSVRVAAPVPARDGRWVVDGWAASAYEPCAIACTDLSVLTASANLFHAELASVVFERPPVMDGRTDRWARAEHLAFDGDDDEVTTAAEVAGTHGLRELLDRLLATRESAGPGPDQLVHGDLSGNVLLDRTGVPVVIDVAPYWRPVLWANAVLTLDAVLWLDADPATIEGWADGRERQAMIRAALFRMLSDQDCQVGRYADALQPLLTRRGGA